MTSSRLGSPRGQIYQVDFLISLFGIEFVANEVCPVGSLVARRVSSLIIRPVFEHSWFV